jgi:hypothetical protein
MGRIADLCGEIAEMAEDGPEGLVLSADGWERLREEWNDDEIQDGLDLVRDSLLLGELVEASDSLSARMVDFLGSYAASVDDVEAGKATIALDVMGQLARRVARLEDVLEMYRDGTPPDHTAFDALQERLAVHGLEDILEIPGLPSAKDEEEEASTGRRARPSGQAPDADEDDEAEER